MEDLDYDYPHSYVEREKLEESSNLLYPKELIEPVKKKLDESPAREDIHGAETLYKMQKGIDDHQDHSESKRDQKYT